MADDGKTPLTRRDLRGAVAACGILSALLAVCGQWFFYSRTEGIRLEERQRAQETRSIEAKEVDRELALQMRSLSDSVTAVQVNNAKLLELYIKALDEKGK